MPSLTILSPLKILLLCLVFFPHVSAAAEESTKGRPAWVDGNAGAEFSEVRYLTAVGSGKNREAASLDARKQLASAFRAKVVSESSSNTEANLNESTEAKTSGKSQTASSSSANVRTEIELRGVEVKNHYKDPTTKEFFALAVLDKLKTKSSYALELQNRKAKIEAQFESYKAKPSVGAAQEILALTEAYETINREYETLNGGRGAPLPLTFAELNQIQASIGGLKAENSIALEFSGEESKPEFQEMITSCLSDKGVSVIAKIEEGKAPEYHVVYNMSEKQKFMDVKGWVKYQFSSLAVVKKGNLQLERKRISKEATGRDKESAFDSVKEDLSEQICTQIAKTVARR